MPRVFCQNGCFTTRWCAKVRERERESTSFTFVMLSQMERESNKHKHKLTNTCSDLLSSTIPHQPPPENYPNQVSHWSSIGDKNLLRLRQDGQAPICQVNCGRYICDSLITRADHMAPYCTQIHKPINQKIMCRSIIVQFNFCFWLKNRLMAPKTFPREEQRKDFLLRPNWCSNPTPSMHAKLSPQISRRPLWPLNASLRKLPFCGGH